MPPRGYGDYQNSYGYAPYASYSSSGSNAGQDKSQYGPHDPTYFQPSSTSNGNFTANGTNNSQSKVSTAVAADEVQFKGNQISARNAVSNQSSVLKPLKPNYQTPLMRSNDFYGWGDLPSAPSMNSSPFSRGTNFSSRRNQNRHSRPHFTGVQKPQAGSGLNQAGLTKVMYSSNRIYGQCPSTFKDGARYVSSSYVPRVNVCAWSAVDMKYRSRAQGSNILVYYGNESVDRLNELNKGPRSKGFKDQKDSEHTSLAVKGQSLALKADEEKLPVFPDREQYKGDDFPEAHSDAKFFIIKSYSEDDVHKSIKYGVWASTPNGNKKLDAAYKEAQEKSGGCPVFLLFSVNASGQFVGLAEMVGPVDFDRSVGYWQQDKWTGCFPVKWHILKDVPNGMLRHLTLENNENKPVTSSRDTQEVKLEQGIEIIKVFKDHSSRTCILDDFEFYEWRQRAMEEKRVKLKQFNNQVRDVVSLEADKDELISKQDHRKIC